MTHVTDTMQGPQDPILVDEFQVGLDRAKITRTSQIHLPESHETHDEGGNDYNPDGPLASSHNVVETIKAKKHRAGLRIRKTLHIGRSSDDFEYTTTALVGAGVEDSGSRYMTDAPEPDKPTVKDFLHNPVDTVKSKISEHTNQQVAGQITAKEIPHGDEVDLIHASEAVEHARDDTQRLLAIKDLSKLVKERQATYARWTLDRHITKIRRLPRDKIKSKPRADFQKHDPQKGIVTDWRAYGQHVGQFFRADELMSSFRVHLTYRSCLCTVHISMEGSILDMAPIRQRLRRKPSCQTSNVCCWLRLPSKSLL
jgi:hypothetical protein